MGSPGLAGDTVVRTSAGEYSWLVSMPSGRVKTSVSIVSVGVSSIKTLDMVGRSVASEESGRLVVLDARS